MTWPFRRLPERRTVIVNTTGERSFRGVVWRRANGYLVLRNGELLQPGGAVTRLDGETLIPEETVEFLQVVSR